MDISVCVHVLISHLESKNNTKTLKKKNALCMLAGEKEGWRVLSPWTVVPVPLGFFKSGNVNSAK